MHCMNVCVNVKLYCKELWVVIKTRKALYKYNSIYHYHLCPLDVLREAVILHLLTSNLFNFSSLGFWTHHRADSCCAVVRRYIKYRLTFLVTLLLPIICTFVCCSVWNDCPNRLQPLRTAPGRLQSVICCNALRARFYMQSRGTRHNAASVSAVCLSLLARVDPFYS